MIRKIKRFQSLVLVFFLIVALLSLSYEIKAASNKKSSDSKAIYVVFDNSGSMYEDGNMAWSQATYAMETFASMLDFSNGDKMKVYTMHNVSTTGSKGKANTNVISVNSDGDISKIHKMYTKKGGKTPYTQVKNAKKQIKNEKASEKWLIVMTDGAFDEDVPKDGVAKDLKNFANADKGIYVQYLGIGASANSLSGEPEEGFYTDKASNSSDVISKLAKISNRIFKRNEIENYKSGDTINFDVPISKVIVFAQGANVSVNNLKNSSGNNVKKQYSQKVSYSTSGGVGEIYSGKISAKTDKSLTGVVATFAEAKTMASGNYVLDVSGAKNG